MEHRTEEPRAADEGEVLSPYRRLALGALMLGACFVLAYLALITARAQAQETQDSQDGLEQNTPLIVESGDTTITAYPGCVEISAPGRETALIGEGCDAFASGGSTTGPSTTAATPTEEEDPQYPERQYGSSGEQYQYEQGPETTTLGTESTPQETPEETLERLLAECESLEEGSAATTAPSDGEDGALTSENCGELLAAIENADEDPLATTADYEPEHTTPEETTPEEEPGQEVPEATTATEQPRTTQTLPETVAPATEATAEVSPEVEDVEIGPEGTIAVTVPSEETEPAEDVELPVEETPSGTQQVLLDTSGEGR